MDPVAKFFREIRECNDVTVGEHNSPFDDIFQFADITGPQVCLQCIEGGRFDLANLLAGFLCGAAEEVEHEFCKIFVAIAECRERERDNVESVEQVFAEIAFGDQLFQIAIGGSHDTDINIDAAVAADRFKPSLLQDSQQLHLSFGGDVTDFVEEQSAAVGGEKPTGFIGMRAGEGTADVSEQFTFKE